MTIAILAHDSRKELALQFCTAYSASCDVRILNSRETVVKSISNLTI